MDEVATRSRIEKHIDLDKAIADLSTNKVLKVGWVEKNRYPEEQGGEYVAQVAAKHEYGYGVPPRPFMGPAIANNSFAWLEMINKGMKKVINGKANILDVLNKVGARAAGDVAKAIRAVTSPSLSPATILARYLRLTSKSARKKGVTATLEKPLIDTGIMFRSVTHAIEDE
jgi:hypothetical protein